MASRTTTQDRKQRAQAMRAAEERRRKRQRMGIAGGSVGLVLVIVIALVVVAVTRNGSSSTAAPSGPAPASVTTPLASVAPASFRTVGAGSASALPIPLSGQPALTSGGKPRVVYIGAEYCPYCAAERWAVVTALSRFGSFSGLGTTHSSGSDVYPNTATLSFHGASYTSDYVSFAGYEQTDPDHKPLDTVPAADEKLLETYDAAPYVPASSAGGIPFIDFGNKGFIVGATYDPQLLAGKSAQQIADAVAQPGSAIGKAVIGAANGITAEVCTATGGNPGSVCGNPTITALQAQISAAK